MESFQCRRIDAQVFHIGFKEHDNVYFYNKNDIVIKKTFDIPTWFNFQIESGKKQLVTFAGAGPAAGGAAPAAGKGASPAAEAPKGRQFDDFIDSRK